MEPDTISGRDLSADGIRRMREFRGMTQIELARRLGVTPTAVRYYEWGKRAPAKELASRLASLLYGPDDAEVTAIADAIMAATETERTLTRAGLERAIGAGIARYYEGQTA